jgi:cobalt/nickel transport system permease protein
VINTFAQIDYLASAGRTPWHRASAVSKLALALSLVGVAVFSPSWLVLVLTLATALALCVTARLPAGLIAAAASTPLLFAFIFVVAHFRGDLREVAVLGMRPIVASLSALWLVGTTPYPDLFAPLSRIMPRVLGDSLFLTYRAVFALLARVERLWRALFLRGAMTGPLLRRGHMLGEAVGTVVLSGFDRSHRLYQVMLLRGHSGRICGCRHWLELGREDAWVFVGMAWVVAVVVFFSGVRLG